MVCFGNGKKGKLPIPVCWLLGHQESLPPGVLEAQMFDIIPILPLIIKWFEEPGTGLDLDTNPYSMLPTPGYTGQ